MLDNIDLKNVLVLDIETVPQYSSYDQLDENWQKLWTKKMNNYIKNDVTAADVYDRAGIYSEFGKIICISVGYFVFDKNDNEYSFRLKSFYGDDEKIILNEFSELLNTKYNTDAHLLCGHNSKEFDFPYIARRCLINGLPIPSNLDNSGKKPWEIKHLDTMDLWKFGDYKSYTSLNLLAAVFGINSPKDDIDGSQVWSVYWIDKDLERIKTYCQKDVVTVAQLLLKFKGMELIKEENVVYTN
ncbi:MAG: 3'-5' exonuclease [Ignavibacteria bacterium]|nr:3'-5' exonuclease [Ignavibacteria bacterium]